MGWMYAGLCERDRPQAGAAPIMRPCADCPIVSSACFCPFFPAAPPRRPSTCDSTDPRHRDPTGRHRAPRLHPPPPPPSVTQQPVRPLPRWALLLLCSAYVVPGFVGREPWKSADITAFGYMLALARGQTPWFGPLLGGMPPESESLLPYWLGAWALQLAPPWLS